ncbi:hypothetical protein Pmar_PMAR024705 [Perkinsus marinus ATCC 50983]|uniref:Uncharacterized protein n=1 Tax=Perkinsus marinus (strain ATCC 50983 / TXsc) TaxID=423536 RepID=C5M134_PERM5|nr:hypothetical protein Pmar_PMAR024705 [Perkinsus marinus ATCC 50983]EEQ97264.1 hypothetical protein Pmar_PMAR024705 [Perkinsus marinus ATCC 50983]|eukprot:XP_002764547.1 hypothetical protein Pmar_PMAR024705 [Perkinsus marinus ATCC 50983]
MVSNTAPPTFLAPATVQSHGFLGWTLFILLLFIVAGLLYWHTQSGRKGPKSARHGEAATAASDGLWRQRSRSEKALDLHRGEEEHTFCRTRGVMIQVAEVTDALLEKRIGFDYSSTASNWDTQNDASWKAVTNKKVPKGAGSEASTAVGR